MDRYRQSVVEVFVFEHEDDTRVHAVLQVGTRTVRGVGTAHRRPQDQPDVAIGEELAIGRALQDLAHRLLGMAETDRAMAGVTN